VNWRPKAKDFFGRRLHLLALLLLDTGARISEALGLRVTDVDLDNMLLMLNGRGRKQRLLPFSFALRKALHRFIVDFLKPDSLLFATQVSTKVRQMTAVRSIKLLCENLGFDPPARILHSFRHCFAAELRPAWRQCLPSPEDVGSFIVGDVEALCFADYWGPPSG
jgi:integrase/recombinase XerD